jgi:non-heme chloroperoxidase
MEGEPWRDSSLLRYVSVLVICGLNLCFSPAEGAAELKYITVNDTRLAYVEAGRGDSVVLVHGGLQDYRFWSAHIVDFAKRYRVIAYSRRNHFPGEVSGDGVQDGAADTHGDDLAELIKNLGLPKAHIVAHSSGAHSALFLAARHPDLVRSLALVEPPATGLLVNLADSQALLKEFGSRFAPAREAFRKRDLENGVRLFADGVGGPGTYDRRSDFEKRMMADNAEAHVADAISTRPRPQFSCEMAARIAIPTLLLRGERSPAFFGRILQELERCMPKQQLVVISTASHSVSAENPAGFQAALLPFLEKH